ncbi:hypothetical protein OAS39_09080 [Pirellulales bacterium]|nr:hypothetical protein [Pirellulales bacterium]
MRQFVKEPGSQRALDHRLGIFKGRGDHLTTHDRDGFDFFASVSPYDHDLYRWQIRCWQSVCTGRHLGETQVRADGMRICKRGFVVAIFATDLTSASPEIAR